MAKILVFEADQAVAWGWRQCLERHGYSVLIADGVDVVERIVDSEHPSLAVIDLRQTDGVGCGLVRRIHDLAPAMPIIGTMINGTTELKSEAMASGAVDVLAKPIDPIRVLSAVGAVLERLGQAIRVKPGTRLESAMAGVSPAMQEVFRNLARAAVSDCPVLIAGPPGSGKSLASWMIHNHSPQREQPYRTIDFRTVPSIESMQSLLADAKEAGGVIEGTLVVDGAMILPDPILADLRALSGFRLVLIADANRDGRFDQHRIERIGVSLVVAIPPLRSRPEDVVPIAGHLLQQQADRTGRSLVLSPQALFAMDRHHWPGNVREMSETIRGAVDLAVDGVILPEHLSLHQQQDPVACEEEIVSLANEILSADEGHAFARWRDRIDAVLIARALERTQGNQQQAAALLGISRPTLRKRCASLGLSNGLPVDSR